MTRCIGHSLLGFLTLLWIGGLLAAAEAVKDSHPAAKTTEAAAKAKEEPAKAKDTPAKTEQTAKTKESSAKSPEEPTHTVKKGVLKIAIDLDGTFEAKTAREIVIKPEEWTALTVETAAAHGAQVREGDVILTLDTEKIDRAIADLKTELKLSEIAVRQGEDQLRALEKLSPLDLEASTRSARIAEEDRKFFAELDRPFAIKATDFGLKMSKESLEYEEEELHQLEKMYKADDITEETEQIVLKRARDKVDVAEFMVEANQLNHDQTLKFTIPRVEDRINDLARRRSLELEKTKVESPLGVERQRLELQRVRVQREHSEDRLKKLQGDRDGMVIKSPIDGIVYYGKATRGRFGDSTSMAESLRRNGSIMPNQVVMTVVQARPMLIRATVSEDQLRRVRPGLKGVATPTAYPNLKLAATVDNVSDVPTGPGTFDARLNVNLDRKAKFLMPGMACKVRLVPYLKQGAITVPPKVIGTDELDDQKHFVRVLGKDGKPEKRSVTVGEKTDKQVEILSGLSEGDKVLLDPTKDEK